MPKRFMIWATLALQLRQVRPRFQASELDSSPSMWATFAAYASVIDNITNDPRTLLPLFGSRLLGGGSTPVVWGTKVTVNVNNHLIYPVDIRTNGASIGTAPASQTWEQQVLAPSSLTLSFDLQRPSPFGVPLGESMNGFFNPVTNPAGTISFDIGNVIGTQPYLAPLITNQTSVGLLMGVNMGLGRIMKRGVTVLSLLTAQTSILDAIDYSAMET